MKRIKRDSFLQKVTLLILIKCCTRSQIVRFSICFFQRIAQEFTRSREVKRIDSCSDIFHSNQTYLFLMD